MQQDEQQPQAGWVFTPESQTAPAPPESHQSPQSPQPPLPDQPAHISVGVGAAEEEDVSWTASEYVAHQKGPEWFILLAMAAIGSAVGLYFLTRDLFSPIVVVVVAAIFGSFAARQPKVLDYGVSQRGIKVGPKVYGYSNFKAFSISEDSAIGSINFLPVKRFMPGLTIHFEDQDEDKIVQALGSYLPLEDHKPEIVDRIMTRLRF